MPNSGATPSPDIPDKSSLPLVGRAVGNRGLWIFGGVVAIAAILLFSALEARRANIVTPATAPMSGVSGDLISAPPALAVPAPMVGEDDYGPMMPANGLRVSSGLGPVALQPMPRSASVAPSRAAPIIPAFKGPAYYDPNSPDPPYVPPSVSSSAYAPARAVAAAAPDPASAAILAGNRVGATRFSNPSATVPQGAVIQAVLETALDSNRPGFVRAIVSRDVRSFDGTRVLIARGSRLFGEYKAELASGQNRAFIQWLTLTRPDGVQIAVNSPAADPLGRAGVKGDVNSHFFQRFAGALLQSTLDLGVGLLTRSANDGTVVVGLPGSTSIINNNSSQPQPTLKVKHGASVSVFVARDLDFTAVI